jgi:hypothetical protein
MSAIHKKLHCPARPDETLSSHQRELVGEDFNLRLRPSDSTVVGHIKNEINIISNPREMMISKKKINPEITIFHAGKKRCI